MTQNDMSPKLREYVLNRLVEARRIMDSEQSTETQRALARETVLKWGYMENEQNV